MSTAFGENTPKYCAQYKSGILKYAGKFQQKCGLSRTASFCTIYFMLVLLCIAHIG
jgi:hypothetical protein